MNYSDVKVYGVKPFWLRLSTRRTAWYKLGSYVHYKGWRL